MWVLILSVLPAYASLILIGIQGALALPNCSNVSHFSSSHDLQSMARIHRSADSSFTSFFDAHLTIQRRPKAASFHIPTLDSWDY